MKTIIRLILRGSYKEQEKNGTEPLNWQDKSGQLKSFFMVSLKLNSQAVKRVSALCLCKCLFVYASLTLDSCLSFSFM